MIALGRGLTVGVIAMGSLGLLAGPVSAAPIVTKTARCSTSAATVSVTFGVADDDSRYGTFRSAQGSASGQFTDDPAMTVRVRDGYGRVVARKRSIDGSLGLSFWRTVRGPNWTAEATIENTAAGACTTPRVKIATS